MKFTKNQKISYRKLIILIIAIILLMIIGIAITMARYRGIGQTTTSAEIAFYVVEEGFQVGNIMLSDLYPRETPFTYDFTVTNTDGTNVSETSMDYEIDMEITTNLPLDIEIYKNGNKLTNVADIENSIVLDDSNQCYIRKIKIKKGAFTFDDVKLDTYTLSAKFPLKYNENEEFEGMIDNVAIKMEAKQKIN